MFIGPWCVDTSDLPSTSSPRPAGAGVSASRSSPSLPELVRKQDRERERRHVFLEQQLERVLEKLNVTNAVWCVGRSKRYYQVLFSVESGGPCEDALRLLGERGIGVLLDSVVSVIPCMLYYQGSLESAADSTEDLSDSSAAHQKDEFAYQARGQDAGPGLGPGQGPGPGGPTPGQGPTPGPSSSKGVPQGAWERFVQSVRARLTVAQVVEGVRANASFTFDFLLLVIVAAFVAALGLLENSTVILVASMLISPLMGPVMAATFGTTIRDRELQRMGFVNEFAGLLLCVALGFLLGLPVGFLSQPWPTEEMLDRGQLRSLWVNVLIALLSGAGISIALLRDNLGSLVGVAISASLLPPAVNAGLLWAMSLVYVVSEDNSLLESEILQISSYYSDNPAIELAVMGGISLCLTIINIVFIVLTGILMLKVKEVAPHSQSQHFWRHDVKIARDYNTTLYGTNGADILQSIAQHNQQSAVELGPDQVHRISPELDRLLRLSELTGRSHTHLMCPLHQLTWSPNTLGCPGFAAGAGSALPTVHELEYLHRQTIQGRRHSQLKSSPRQKWRLGSSDGFYSFGSRARLQHARGARARTSTPPFTDMLGPMPTREDSAESRGRAVTLRTPEHTSEAGAGAPVSLFFTPSGAEGDRPAGRVLLSVSDETERSDQRRREKKRRFVVTKTDDSELLIPTPAESKYSSKDRLL